MKPAILTDEAAAAARSAFTGLYLSTNPEQQRIRFRAGEAITIEAECSAWEARAFAQMLLDYAAAVDAAGMGALHNANLKALMGAVASAAPNNAVTATPTIGDMVRTLGKSGGPIVPLPPTLHCETTWTSDGELAGAGLDRGEPWGWVRTGQCGKCEKFIAPGSP